MSHFSVPLNRSQSLHKSYPHSSPMGPYQWASKRGRGAAHHLRSRDTWRDEENPQTPSALTKQCPRGCFCALPLTVTLSWVRMLKVEQLCLSCHKECVEMVSVWHKTTWHLNLWRLWVTNPSHCGTQTVRYVSVWIYVWFYYQEKFSILYGWPIQPFSVLLCVCLWLSSMTMVFKSK